MTFAHTIMWGTNVGFRFGCEVFPPDNSVTVMDYEVLLGLGSPGNPQAQQRVSIILRAFEAKVYLLVQSGCNQIIPFLFFISFSVRRQYMR